MDWKDVASVVGKAAPMLGTILLGPAGGAAGAIIASALGAEHSPDAVSAALASNPDVALKLRQIEAEQQLALRKLAMVHAHAELRAETRRIEIAADDRKSARQREVDTKDSLTPRLLALAITTGFFGVLLWLLKYGKPETGGDALLVMLGSLGAAFSALVAYYWGSSSGSDFKTRILATKDR